jgi:hypothetical protein
MFIGAVAEHGRPSDRLASASDLLRRYALDWLDLLDLLRRTTLDQQT